MSDDPLDPEIKQFFQTYRLQRAPRASTCARIERYVQRGNRTLGVTPDRRADIVRQLQIEWNGQRVDYLGQRTGTVLYIVPDNLMGPNRQPRFEAMVRWNKPISGDSKKITTSVGLSTLKHIGT